MGLRIFVIDDEECVRDSLQIHLEGQGHEVLTCERPHSCAVFQGHDCRNDSPCGHALFIDYFLPGMNGLDFIETMHQRGCKGLIRHKFLMSGDTTAIDHERAEKLGCQIIQKPLTLEIVDEIINDVQVAVDPDEHLADLVFN